MGKGLMTACCVAGAYLAAGVGVAVWTAARGESKHPHFQGHEGASAAVGLLEAVALWPWAAYVNVTSK